MTLTDATQTTAPPPDRLSVLSAGALDALRDRRRHATLAAQSTLVACAALQEARRLCAPEEWADWLKAARIDMPTAKALLDFERLAFDARSIAEMGGEALAATWAAEVHLPPEGEALAVSVGEWTEERHVPVGYVWRAPEGGFCVGLFDFEDPTSRSLASRRAMHDERTVWATLWLLLGGVRAEMLLHPIREGVEDIVAACEAHRQALIKKGVPHVH
ncbi:hypothetical protein Rumeso_03432 [Rubellimicrobium mesophilum DSM 19309]|uniref:Uncharacterized protein n=1 Tax=Rubellimicrobium mesophilum DSM 19309 TaxID=442562 RepID=A0A017HLH6_9RHOB|nr:hypothetical protein [Rubellimicrobium mesophilum]EYD75008.1 hypothetical protein Rumeso_03432 [Rubellimicrobium mesophilum DSM 19309]